MARAGDAKNQADLLSKSGTALPDWAAACTVEAEWAADCGNVLRVQY